MRRFWRWLRNLDRIDALTKKALELNRERDAFADSSIKFQEQVALEYGRRVSAETLSAERLQRISSLTDEVRYLREQSERIIGERLKSLDALNLKLMEPRVEPPPPDPKQFRRDRNADPAEMARLQANVSAVKRAREMDRAVDMLLLGKLNPGAIGRRAPAGPTNMSPPTPPTPPTPPPVDETGAA